jgi:hypothetical protein
MRASSKERQEADRFQDELSARRVSARDKKAAAGGVIFEIFIVDNKGLNVAQTDPTLDYMQGDEAKFQKTFLVGPEAVSTPIFIGCFLGQALRDEKPQ